MHVQLALQADRGRGLAALGPRGDVVEEEAGRLLQILGRIVDDVLECRARLQLVGFQRRVAGRLSVLVP